MAEEMTKERMGEIALALLKYQVEDEGIHISKKNSRKLGIVAKETGVPLAELKRFQRILIDEQLEEILGK